MWNTEIQELSITYDKLMKYKNKHKSFLSLPTKYLDKYKNK